MSNALSTDLRRRILDEIDQGVSQSQVARTYRVDRKTVWSLIQHRRKTGSLEPIRVGMGRKSNVAHRRADIEQAIAKNSSLTLQSLIDQLGLTISVSALSRTLRRWGIRLKKSPVRRRAATSRREAETSLVGNSGTASVRSKTRFSR